MDNIKTVTDTDGVEHIIIDRGNGEFTSMPKSVYDKMISAPTASLHQPLVEG